MCDLNHLEQVVCSHLQDNNICGDCAMEIELPSAELQEEKQNAVSRIDFVQQLTNNLPTPTPNRIHHMGLYLTPFDYACFLVQDKNFCGDLAIRNDRVAVLDVSLKEIIETGRKCIRKRTPEDCRCKTHNFVNIYARVVQNFMDRLTGCHEFNKLSEKDMMKQMQFAFPRFVSYNMAYYSWKETMTEKSRNNLYADLEFLVEPRLLEAVHDDIDDLLFSDEEFELLGTVLLFEAGVELSPSGRGHFHSCQKVYVSALAEYLHDSYAPDFSGEDVIVRLCQLLRVFVNLGEMANGLGRSLVLATAFNWAELQGNLSYDLHLREF